MNSRSISLFAATLACLGQRLTATEQVINPVSTHPVIIDGHFSGGVSGGVVLGEWSDVTPLAFISPSTSGGILQSVPISDPLKNSLLYAALAPGSVGPTELYLMYDYLPRTTLNFVPGEFVADIKFPVTVGGTKFPNSMVSIRGDAGFFDVFVDIQGDGSDKRPISDLGIEAAVGLGPSTLAGPVHMLIELEVPLLIPANFGSPNNPFPAGGLPAGVYSPDPAFWGGFEANDANDPQSTAAMFTINPDGSTLAVAQNGAIPEPSTFGAAALLGAGLIFHCWQRSKK